MLQFVLVLVTFTTYGATSLSQIPLKDKSACEQAKKSFDKEFKGTDGMVQTFCVQLEVSLQGTTSVMP